MKGGAKLYARGFDNRYSGPVESSYTADPTETGVCVDISDGAQFFAGVDRVSGNAFYSGGGVMLVRGADTLCRITAGYAYVGYHNDNSVLHVTDGAQLVSTNESMLICNSAARRNVSLYVDDGGSATANVVYLGSWSSFGQDMHMVAGPNGTIDIRSRLYVAGTNNYVVVSNGTLRLANITFGFKNTDRELELKLYGPSAHLDISSIASLFASGSGHRFVLDGGAVHETSSSFYFANGSSATSGAYTSNTVEIVNGSRLVMGDSFYTRNYANGTVAANGNTVRVASGGELACKSFQLACADNTVVLSNGTLSCSFSDAFVCSSDQHNKENTLIVPTTGARVILEGENPLLQGTGSSSTAYFRYGAKIIFRPSLNGFSTAAALMSFGTYSTDGTATLVFEGLEEVQRNLTHTATYTLAEARKSAGTVAFTDAQLAAAEGLPSGCTLYRSSDNKRLLLRVRPDKGYVISIL